MSTSFFWRRLLQGFRQDVATPGGSAGLDEGQQGDQVHPTDEGRQVAAPAGPAAAEAMAIWGVQTKGEKNQKKMVWKGLKRYKTMEFNF